MRKKLEYLKRILESSDPASVVLATIFAMGAVIGITIIAMIIYVLLH